MSSWIESLSVDPGRGRRTAARRRRLSLFLALAVLFCAWVESEHVADLEAHEADTVCATCLFTGALGCGLTPSLSLWASFQPAAVPVMPRMAAVFPLHLRSNNYQRGPPLGS